MTTVETRAAVERFHQAVNSNDAAAVAAAMTEDCVFESTPPPDGERLQGTAEVAGFFQKLFDTAARRTFDIEELIISGDRAVLRWYHQWTEDSGRQGHVRGVDVFRVRDGKIAEKLSYVKG